MSKAYRFEIAANQNEDKLLVLDVEIYARMMSISEQLRLEKARKQAQTALRQAKPGDEVPTVLEAELDAFVPMLRERVVNGKDRKKVTKEWGMQLTAEQYYRLFNFLATGRDLDDEDDVGEGDNPNAKSQT